MDSIHLTHYRNYTDKTFSLGQHTLFIGPNGSGKTNVIEAIRTISVTKSFRIQHDRDAIQWGQDYCRVALEYAGDKFEYILTRESLGAKKVIKHNGLAIPLTQVYGLLPTVLFSPETMQLIDGAPQERRRFLDTILSQADLQYLEDLMTYRKVLRERHHVLLRIQQGLGQSDELDFWDNELVRTGTYIIEQRRELINQFNTILNAVYARFVPEREGETFQLKYKGSVSAEKYRDRLKSARPYDIKSATTMVGPHRDELVFLLRDRDVILFASRGELRRCVIATKVAEAEILKTRSTRVPLVLLDDVFSELDADRRKHFLESVRDYHTVITTTDEAFTEKVELPSTILHRLPEELEPVE